MNLGRPYYWSNFKNIPKIKPREWTRDQNKRRNTVETRIKGGVVSWSVTRIKERVKYRNLLAWTRDQKGLKTLLKVNLIKPLPKRLFRTLLSSFPTARQDPFPLQRHCFIIFHRVCWLFSCYSFSTLNFPRFLFEPQFVFHVDR